jgi:FlaA1/EpsC-like NDP-sugar epimerase
MSQKEHMAIGSQSTPTPRPGPGLFLIMRNRYLALVDIALLSLAPLLAIWVRLEGHPAAGSYVVPMMVFTAVMVGTKVGIYARTGLYAEFWPYASTEELVTLSRAIGLGFLGELVMFFAVLLPLKAVPDTFPLSLPILDALLSVLLVGGSRVGIRIWFAYHKRLDEVGTPEPVLVAGAGVAGSMIIKEMKANGQLGLNPIGIVDDDPHKQGIRIHGVRVLGRIEDLSRVLQETGATEVIIAIPTASGKVVRGILQACKDKGVKSKTIPGLFEILQGSAGVAQIRNIRLEDLLRRGSVKADSDSLMPFFRGMKVLVTGAGGSIGSELCRQVKDLAPSDLVLVGHGENSIYQIARELRESLRPGVRVHRVIADIRDRERMEQVFREQRPDVVLHAAAHKHVPLMEDNIPDAVTNNVLGTRVLIEHSIHYGVKKFVLVSSDKAVNPTSVMGVTKRIAELMVQDAAMTTGRPFITVRFGNVLGSRGSVVPLFEDQIDRGGPVTITHPDVRRYFMTIPESVQLILQATTMGRGGEVYVLDMGEQIKLVDLARDLIKLRGLDEPKDIEIRFTGLRRGEKMYEELFAQDAKVESTEHEKILVCKNGFPQRYQPQASLAAHEQPLLVEVSALLEAARAGDGPAMDRLFRELVPEYHTPAQEGRQGLTSPDHPNSDGGSPGAAA